MLAFSQYDSVGLTVLHNLVSKEHVFYFLCGRCFRGCSFQIFRLLDIQVTVLYQHTIQERTELLLRQCGRLANQNNTVFLLSQDFQCVYIVIRSDNYLEEDFIDFLSSVLIDHSVCDEYTTESGNRVTGQCIVPCFEHRGA